MNPDCTTGITPDLIIHRLREVGVSPSLYEKHDGVWTSISGDEVVREIEQFAWGLQAMGVNPGDRVALVLENCSRWLIADTAIMAIGAITVPGYPSYTVEDLQLFFQDSGAKIGITASGSLLGNVEAAAMGSALQLIVVADRGGWSSDRSRRPVSSVPIKSWDDITDRAPPGCPISPKKPLNKEDTACIFYTSGTSARPVGVMLSHRNIVANVNSTQQILEKLMTFSRHRQRFLSFLPLCHAYEHMAGQLLPICAGAEIYYAKRIEKLASDFLEVRPTIVTAVPRLLETMRSRILIAVQKGGGLQSRLFARVLGLGSRTLSAPHETSSVPLSVLERLEFAILDKLISRKVRNRFGGRLIALVSGGAPLEPGVGSFFLALGVPVLQGYGQTEASPVISVHVPGEVQLNTVGPPLPGVEVNIAEDGEIRVRGDLVMKGYWLQDERTRRTIRNGWLHTGDVGHFNSSGHLVITDRMKDIIVSSGGDTISPAHIEGRLCREPEIAQAAVFGDRKNHVVGILVADEDTVRASVDCRNRSSTSTGPMAVSTRKKQLEPAVRRANADLSLPEKVRNFYVVSEPFSIEAGTLTPSYKIRRRAIGEKYADLLSGPASSQNSG